MRSEGARLARADGTPLGADAEVELIELLFFAYRDFVGDADRLLETYKFGRAHHRALHFVNRRPGLTVAEFDTFPPTVRTLRAFIASYHELLIRS